MAAGFVVWRRTSDTSWSLGRWMFPRVYKSTELGNVLSSALNKWYYNQMFRTTDWPQFPGYLYIGLYQVSQSCRDHKNQESRSPNITTWPASLSSLPRPRSWDLHRPPRSFIHLHRGDLPDYPRRPIDLLLPVCRDKNSIHGWVRGP